MPRDPDQRTFGKWFRSFKTEGAGPLSVMSKIDEPHQNIHQPADKLIELRDKGEKERATRLLSGKNYMMLCIDKLSEQIVKITPL